MPVLAGVFGYGAHRAVALNLAVSLVTVLSALLIRGATLSVAPLSGLVAVALAMIAGSVTAAYLGVGLVHHVSEALLERFIFVLLLGIGVALIAEAFLPTEIPALLPGALWVRLLCGLLFGLAIGLVSSVLGVAGGELIIPTLVFAFGAPIVAAGTASLIISLPTVAVGVARHRRLGALADPADLRGLVVPMAAGSVVGAVIGGLLAGVVSAALLKLVLGVILIISALRTFKH